MYYKKLPPKPCRNGNHDYVEEIVFGNQSPIRRCRLCGKTPHYHAEQGKKIMKENY